MIAHDSVRLAALSLCLVASATIAQEQVLQPHNTGPSTHTLNSGPNTAYFRYYDSGGPNGAYEHNASREQSVLTFQAAADETLTVFFTDFRTESGHDALYVFDGPNAASTLISSGKSVPPSTSGCADLDGGWRGTGSEEAPSNVGARSQFPTVVRSSGNSLTFAFCSDSSNRLPGWVADVLITGDTSLDGRIDVADVLTVINGIRAQQDPDQRDTDGNGVIDRHDVDFAIAHFLKRAP